MVVRAPREFYVMCRDCINEPSRCVDCIAETLRWAERHGHAAARRTLVTIAGVTVEADVLEFNGRAL